LIIRKSEKLLQRILMPPNGAEKIYDMGTLLAKMQQSAKYVAIAYLHFSDMPIRVVDNWLN